MRRARILAATGSLAAITALALVVGRRRPTDAHASDPPPSPPPSARLAIVHGEVDGDFADVAIAEVSASGATLRPLGRVEHAHGSARRGAILGGAFGDEAALVVVDEAGDRRSSYRAALFRVDHGKATRLCGEVSRLSTPIVTRSGRVLIERGADGPEPSEDDARHLRLRVDELRVDEVDPWSGAITPRWNGRGYVAYLATAFGLSRDGAGVEEIAIDFQSATASQLLALDPATGRTRTLAPSIPPFARDFSWDAAHARIVFADLASRDSRRTLVFALDPSSSALTTTYASAHDHPSPFALVGGDLAVSSDGDRGLDVVLAGGRTVHVAPLGDGVDRVTAASPDGRWIAMRHTPKEATRGEPPHTIALDLETRRFVDLGVPRSEEVESLGFLAGDGR